MGRFLITTTAALGLFFRCGRAFTAEGVIVAEDEFTEEQWQRVRAEPMLHISAAPDEAETAAAEQSDLRAELRRIIAGLAPEDFGADGVPLVGSIRTALPGVADITEALVTEVWAELKDQQP